jgi:hypothetical protein
MLPESKQYQIYWSVELTRKEGRLVRFVSVSDKKKILFRNVVNVNFYESWTEKNFKLAAICCAFYNKKNLFKEFEKDLSKYKRFKDYFSKPNFYFSKDQNYMEEKYGKEFDVKDIMKEYLSNKISLLMPLFSFEEIDDSSRILKFEKERLRFLSLYIDREKLLNLIQI